MKIAGKQYWRAVTVLVILTTVVGCGPSGPKTVPIRGTVTLEGGDVSLLAGHLVEGVQEGNPAVRASGVIEKDGSFSLESLLEGEVRKGAAPGKYKARIVLCDDTDDNGKKLPRPQLPRRFFEVASSGLTFVVPDGPGDVQLALTARGK